MVADYDPVEWARRRAAEDPRHSIDALPERTDDFPPRDMFHAARMLNEILHDTDREEIDAPSDPALWGRLDVNRAAALTRERHPEAFRVVASTFSWLNEAADSAATGAMGLLGDQF